MGEVLGVTNLSHMVVSRSKQCNNMRGGSPHSESSAPVITCWAFVPPPSMSRVGRAVALHVAGMVAPVLSVCELISVTTVLPHPGLPPINNFSGLSNAISIRASS